MAHTYLSPYLSTWQSRNPSHSSHPKASNLLTSLFLWSIVVGFSTHQCLRLEITILNRTSSPGKYTYLLSLLSVLTFMVCSYSH